MDLRKAASLTQKISEYSIRFRLIEIVVAVLLCAIAIFNIDGILVPLLQLSQQAETVIADIVQGNFHVITASYGVIFAVLTLFLFRWKFFGFKCAWLWFFFLIFNGLLLLVVEECREIIQILLAVIFVIAVTDFFFIRTMFMKAMLPLIVLGYSLSVWLLFLGTSNLVWFGLFSLFFADASHLIFVTGHQIRKKESKKTLSAAIAHGVRKTIPVSLLSIILLIILDIAFYYMNLPQLASENLLLSFFIYICYAIWMPFFAAAVFSFCPLENTCEKMQEKSK
jgi:hypothetical protein